MGITADRGGNERRIGGGRQLRKPEGGGRGPIARDGHWTRYAIADKPDYRKAQAYSVGPSGCRELIGRDARGVMLLSPVDRILNRFTFGRDPWLIVPGARTRRF